MRRRDHGARGRGAGLLWGIALVLSAAFVIVAAALLYAVVSGGVGDDPSHSREEAEEAELAPSTFDSYSWDELSQVARLIAEAGDDEEAKALAERYGVSVGSVRPLVLTDGTTVEMRVVGLRHDARSDGVGKAGLTIMLGPIALAPMNEAGTVVGGWEASSLRAWLAGEGGSLLPEGLADVVVPVVKATNNVGVAGEASAVTTTSDELWCFSVTEVCGAVTWFADEFGSSVSPLTGNVDFSALDALVSSEGAQYAYFSQASVTGDADPLGALALTYRDVPCAWWYRTPYPYSFDGEEGPFFYQVMSSGFPSSVGRSEEPAGVVIGLCL